MNARLWFGLLVAATTLACSQKTLPAYGEVLLLLSSDMPVPDSFDTLIVTVNGHGRAYRSATAKLESKGTPDPGCLVGEGTSTPLDKSVDLRLPTTLALTSERDEPLPGVTVTIAACKNNQLIHKSHDLLLDLPQSGQVKMLRVPIRWLCNDRSRSCLACNGSNGTDAQQPCYHKDITRLTNAPAGWCEAEACDSEPEIVAYADDVASRYDPDSTSCFDPWACFGMSEDSQFDAHAWRQLPAGWQSGDADAGESATCVATLDSSSLDDSRLNLALVLPPGGQGFCNRSRCFVPLDKDAAVGWRNLDRAKRLVSLPNAVCHLLDSGQISYVIAATGTQCTEKGLDDPICTSIEAPTPPDNTARLVDYRNPNRVYLPLDEAGDDPKGSLLDSDHGPRLQRVTMAGTPPKDLTSDIAVMGRAGRFNSLNYARGPNTSDLLSARTFSAWVSLTELPSDDSHRMPILSNVNQSCSAGVRLELRSCTGDPLVYVALGLPRGPADASGCKLAYQYARLTGKSYRGGFFDPWKIGTYYHVAATLEQDGRAQLWVDGERSEPANVPCGYATSSVEGSDLDWFVLGSHVPLATATTPSHDLLLDEVAMFAAALDGQQVQRLGAELSTQSGASGLRWGPWATQGSTSRIDTTRPLPRFSIVDEQASSAGAFASLGTTDVLLSKEGKLLDATPDLSEFDEAVLVVDRLPAATPFQFALVAAHGRRQCTWQLQAVPERPSDDTSPDTYVINLRKPSWCVDPSCSFDTRSIAWVSLGSEWNDSKGQETKRVVFDYVVQSLSFRKRPTTDSAIVPKYLGGVFGPSNWCWKSISYVAPWEVSQTMNASLANPLNPVAMPAPTPNGAATQDLPELAADLPDDDGPRDMSSCQYVRFDMQTGTPNPVNSNLKFAVTNEQSQTCDWNIIAPPTGYATVDLTPDGTRWSPKGSAPSCKTILGAVTRLSVRYSGSLVVNSVECCPSPDNCFDIGSVPLSQTW